MVWALITAMVLGVIGGFFIGRLSSASHRKNVALEAELKETKEKLNQHHAQVTEHFTKTATLIAQMTESYQAVFTHLAEGADNLCTNNPHLGRLFHAKVEDISYKTAKSPDNNPTLVTITETPKDYVL